MFNVEKINERLEIYNISVTQENLLSGGVQITSRTPLRKDENGIDVEFLFVNLKIFPDHSKEMHLILSHSRRRLKHEMIENQPEKIYKKVRGAKSKVEIDVLGKPIPLIMQEIHDFLSLTKDMSREHTLDSLLPQDDPSLPVKAIFQRGLESNLIELVENQGESSTDLVFIPNYAIL